jgi:hypothetical protein
MDCAERAFNVKTTEVVPDASVVEPTPNVMVSDVASDLVDAVGASKVKTAQIASIRCLLKLHLI